MTSSATAETAIPLQWVFKGRAPDGRRVEWLLRRVKPGQESAATPVHAGADTLHIKAKYSDSHTFIQLLDDPLLHDAPWIKDTAHRLLQDMRGLKRLPQLGHAFCPKGKIEYYGPEFDGFAPLYIASNQTMKLHAAQPGGGFAHLAAQHLDYPFGPGERRFSTSRLFDCCFVGEKLIAPSGLAATIDRTLQAQGIYQPQRHDIGDEAHLHRLLDGESAAIGSSYARVLQRERFAAFIAACATGTPPTAPLLRPYLQLIEADLRARAGGDFADYPPKKMDEVAAAAHLPLMMIFKPGTHGRFKATV